MAKKSSQKPPEGHPLPLQKFFDLSQPGPGLTPRRHSHIRWQDQPKGSGNVGEVGPAFPW
jgi:hypothetical protein